MLLTIGEAAKLLNIHHNTLRRWIKQKRFRAIKINERGDCRISENDILAYLETMNPKEDIDRVYDKSDLYRVRGKGWGKKK